MPILTLSAMSWLYADVLFGSAEVISLPISNLALTVNWATFMYIRTWARLGRPGFRPGPPALRVPSEAYGGREGSSDASPIGQGRVPIRLGRSPIGINIPIGTRQYAAYYPQVLYCACAFMSTLLLTRKRDGICCGSQSCADGNQPTVDPNRRRFRPRRLNYLIVGAPLPRPQPQSLTIQVGWYLWVHICVISNTSLAYLVYHFLIFPFILCAEVILARANRIQKSLKSKTVAQKDSDTHCVGKCFCIDYK